MPQPTTKTKAPGLQGGQLSPANLSVFNRQPLTPEQQMQALKRVQSQAEQRVKLGMQLFKAAETRLTNQTEVLQQIKSLQTQLREQVNQDVAKTLQQYDQWIGQIDESFTTAIRKLEEKIDAVQSNLNTSEARMQKMLDRAEAMLDQTRALVEQSSLGHPAPSKIDNPEPPQQPQPQPETSAPPTPTVSTHTDPLQVAIPFNPPPLPTKPFMPPTPSAKSDPTPAHATPNPTPNADTEITSPPATSTPSSDAPANNDDHKIYSKLLKRLIDEDHSAETHGSGKDTAPANDDEQPQADAA